MKNNVLASAMRTGARFDVIIGATSKSDLSQLSRNDQPNDVFHFDDLFSRSLGGDLGFDDL
jgi:hypothetical protein